MTTTSAADDVRPFDRKLLLKALLGMLVLMLAAGFATGGLVRLIRSQVPGSFEVVSRRFKEIRERVPGVLAETKDRVVLVGSSEPAMGFIPAVFDQVVEAESGRNVDTLNLAMFNLTTTSQLEFAERLVTHELRDYPVDAILIEFDYMRATVHEQAIAFEAQTAFFAPLSVLADEFVRSPARGARMFTQRWFSDYGTPATTSYELRQWLLPTPSWWPPPVKPNLMEYTILEWWAIVQVFRPYWDVERRGGPPRDEETLKPLEKQIAYMSTLEGQGLYFQEVSIYKPPHEMEFIDAEIDKYIASIKLYQSASKNVLIYFAPANYKGPFQSSDKSIANFRAMVARIHRETGACVMDLLQSPVLGHSDYIDLNHANPTGAVKLSTYLGKRFAAWRNAGAQGCAGWTPE